MRGDTWAPGGTEMSCDEYGWIEPPSQRLGSTMAGSDPDDPMARAFYGGRLEDDHDFDEACVRTAEAWLGRRPGDRPWCLYVPLLFPHCPFATSDPWFSMHDRAAVPAPATTDRARRPRFMQAIHDRYGLARLDESDWREIIATY